jgi:hypothetical protein
MRSCEAALNTYAIFRCGNAIAGMREKVILRLMPELVAGTQFMTEIDTNGGNGEHNRGPANNPAGNFLFAATPTNRHLFCILSDQLIKGTVSLPS